MGAAKQVVCRAAGVLFTIALATAGLMWLLATPQGSAVATRAAALGPWGWALSVAAVLGTYGLRAARVFCEWRTRGRLAPADCLLAIVVHAAAVNLLPMRAGELGYPVLLNRRLGIPLGEAATSLAWMRLQDMATVAWIATLTFVAWALGRGLLGPATAGALAVACTVAFFVCAVQAGRLAERGFGAVRRQAAGGDPSRRRHRALLRLCDAASAAASRQQPGTWLWSVAYWLAKLATLALLLQALAPMPGFAAWCGALGGDGAMALPLQPTAGFGPYEAGVALAATAAGAPQWRDVLAAALVVHVFMAALPAIAATALWLARAPAATLPRLEG